MLRNVNLICLPTVPTSNCYNLGGGGRDDQTAYIVFKKYFKFNRAENNFLVIGDVEPNPLVSQIKPVEDFGKLRVL